MSSAAEFLPSFVADLEAIATALQGTAG